VGRDSRPYMRAAYEAFRDGAGADAIAAAAGPDPEAGPAFYSWLYVGLYHEAHGEPEAARAALLRWAGRGGGRGGPRGGGGGQLPKEQTSAPKRAAPRAQRRRHGVRPEERGLHGGPRARALPAARLGGGGVAARAASSPADRRYSREHLPGLPAFTPGCYPNLVLRTLQGFGCIALPPICRGSVRRQRLLCSTRTAHWAVVTTLNVYAPRRIARERGAQRQGAREVLSGPTAAARPRPARVQRPPA
jgi:hypothetical protein